MIFAGVIGLLAVGLTLLLVAFVAKGKGGGGAPAKAVRKSADKKPAKVT